MPLFQRGSGAGNDEGAVRETSEEQLLGLQGSREATRVVLTQVAWDRRMRGRFFEKLSPPQRARRSRGVPL